MSASVVDAADAVAAAPVADMFCRGTIDPLKASSETDKLMLTMNERRLKPAMCLEIEIRSEMQYLYCPVLLCPIPPVGFKEPH